MLRTMFKKTGKCNEMHKPEREVYKMYFSTL